MIVQAEVSLYPLRTADLSASIESFIDALDGKGLEIEPGPMSTRITGQCTRLFSSIGESFDALADHCQAVLIVKVSNACPSKHPAEPGSARDKAS